MVLVFVTFSLLAIANVESYGSFYPQRLYTGYDNYGISTLSRSVNIQNTYNKHPVIVDHHTPLDYYGKVINIGNEYNRQNNVVIPRSSPELILVETYSPVAQPQIKTNPYDDDKADDYFEDKLEDYDDGITIITGFASSGPINVGYGVNNKNTVIIGHDVYTNTGPKIQSGTGGFNNEGDNSRKNKEKENNNYTPTTIPATFPPMTNTYNTNNVKNPIAGDRDHSFIGSAVHDSNGQHQQITPLISQFANQSGSPHAQTYDGFIQQSQNQTANNDSGKSGQGDDDVVPDINIRAFDMGSQNESTTVQPTIIGVNKDKDVEG